jgi:hypothetical protein
LTRGAEKDLRRFRTHWRITYRQNLPNYFPEKAAVGVIGAGGLRRWPTPQDFRGLVAEPAEAARGTATSFMAMRGMPGAASFTPKR